MAYGIGSRKSRETYPQSPAAAGGNRSAVGPLARTLFVDADAEGVVAPNGAAVVGRGSGGPYPTISDAVAAFAVPQAALDADTAYIVEVSPAVAGYAESPVISHYQTAEIRLTGTPDVVKVMDGSLVVRVAEGGGAVHGDSYQGVSLTWYGITGDFIVETDGSWGVQIQLNTGGVYGDIVNPGAGELQVYGDSVVLGDLNMPSSGIECYTDNFYVVGDTTALGLYIPGGTVQFVGDVNLSSGSENTIAGCSFGGSYSAAGPTLADGCSFGGDVTSTQNLQATGCSFSEGTLTCPAGAQFYGCTWAGAGTLVGFGTSIAIFDGPSYRSFVGGGYARRHGRLRRGGLPGRPRRGRGARRVERARHAGRCGRLGRVRAGGQPLHESGGWQRRQRDQVGPSAVDRVGDTVGLQLGGFAGMSYNAEVLDDAGNVVLSVTVGNSGFVVLRCASLTASPRWVIAESASGSS